ncbi:MAG: glycerol-3-phosphate acyltransferase, partial [Chloroflexota bacterium]
MLIVELVAVVVIAYLIGSIPFGLIIGKLKGGVDIREHGSGKSGATNVMRTLGTRLGVLTLVLDVVKAGGAVM